MSTRRLLEHDITSRFLVRTDTGQIYWRRRTGGINVVGVYLPAFMAKSVTYKAITATKMVNGLLNSLPAGRRAETISLVHPSVRSAAATMAVPTTM